MSAADSPSIVEKMAVMSSPMAGAPRQMRLLSLIQLCLDVETGTRRTILAEPPMELLPLAELTVAASREQASTLYSSGSSPRNHGARG